MTKLIIHSDGGARGNPGSAGIGYVITDSNENIAFQGSEYIGETTNNVAEYQALQKALEHILEEDFKAKEIVCYLDSELVVKQLKGEYKIKKEHLFQLSHSINLIIKKLKQIGLEQISFIHVPREQNRQADSLVNQAIDAFLENVSK